MEPIVENQSVGSTTLDLSQEKALIVYQLQKLIARHPADENVKTKLNQIINEVTRLNSNTILLDFKKIIEDGEYLLPSFVKKSLIGFVEMELSGRVMEAIASDKLNSTEILGYIKEGEKYAATVKKLDIVVFVGNTSAGKSTMINAIAGRKMVWAKYLGVIDNKQQVEYEEETLFDLPEIKRLANEQILTLKHQVNGWVDGYNSIDSFLGLLRAWGVNVTPNVSALAQKAIDTRERGAFGGLNPWPSSDVRNFAPSISGSPSAQGNVDSRRMGSPSAHLKRVIQVDAREGNKPPLAEIGHTLNSTTFYPQAYEDEGMIYCDCPGFGETRTEAIEIANSVNIMQMISQARSVKVVITINFHSLRSEKAKGLRDLWSIMANLFGDLDNVIKYRDSILINVSQVPEIGDESFPNSLEGIRNVLGERAELIPLLDRIVICSPLDRAISRGSILLAEFSNKINALQPIRNPSRVFRTAMSKATGTSLVLFAKDAEKDIVTSMGAGNFESAYNKLHYLMQLNALKYAPLNHEIQEIKARITQQLYLHADTIYSKRKVNDLDIFTKQLNNGIHLDRLTDSDIVKHTYFKAKVLLLKFLIKQPIFQKEIIDQHIEDIYGMMNYLDMPSCPSVVQVFIDDLFFKGNEVAIFPNIAKKAEKLFNKFNEYLAIHQEARYGVMTVSDFEIIGQLAQKTAQEIFAILKDMRWLVGEENSREAKIAITEQALLAGDIQLPPELNTVAVKKEVLELFEKRLLIDTFFAKKFLKFKEDQELSKQAVVNSIVNTIGNQREAREYKLYQVKSLLAQYFSHEKAPRYLMFLSSLKLLDADLASKRYKLLKKIIENFRVLNDTLTQVSSHVPVGSVHMIPSNHVPSGFKECDGQWLSVNAYAALYHVIRNTFGEQETPQDGKQFRLPDYRGYFLRGTTQNRFFNAPENDTTRLPRAGFSTSNSGNHIHEGNTSYNGTHSHHIKSYLQRGDANYISAGGNGNYHKSTDGSGYDGDHLHTLNITASGNHAHTIGGGDPETRPQNYPVTYMMKY